MPESEKGNKRRRRAQAAPAEPARPVLPFPVVGIAASAGGLEAYKALFSAMPAGTGMAFVLVPHLDPSHASLMVELLRPYANMQIQEAEEGTKVQPDMVYVIPPNRNLEIRDGVLRLSVFAEPRQQTTPIDLFLRSLAEDQHEMAIGILLSGTGSHGTVGLKAIKANGGMTLVQEPGEAVYDQMPRSAVAADVADQVLPVAEMPEALSAYLQHPYVNGTARQAEAQAAADYLTKVLSLLKARTKYDFGAYRKNMLMRRVQRRMSLNQIQDPDRYLSKLREEPGEVAELLQDFLISVSSFFRDSEAYGVLALQILPELIQRKSQGDTPIRIWVPGCATGEEAYSVAMLMYEAMDRENKHVPFQIFATDISEAALKAARLGTYPESINVDVSQERLQRFFNRMDHHYQVNKHLREPLMFAAQNVVSDTPFSKLDLISCRNLLIYLEPETQQRLLALFHFALNEHGYLFLGTSETVGRQTDLFEPVSKKYRIFKRVGPVRAERLEFPLGNHTLPYAAPPAKLEPLTRVTKMKILAQEVLIDAYVPAAVLVDRKFEILYLHGATNKYLSMPPGEPTHDLMTMAHEGLGARIRSLCYQVGKAHDGEVRGDAHVKSNGKYTAVRITVKEVRHPKALEGKWLVTFEDLPAGKVPNTAKVMDAAESESVVQQLEFELKTTREDLQSTIEELESSNEELKSSNEEMMSMNEELQSVNEELETSKEELQSLNEELNTVNSQLEEKVEELDKANNDLTNLLNSTDISTVFLDTRMRVRRFTPSTMKLLNLIPGDIGRSISDFSYKFTDDSLVSDGRRVLETLIPADKHVWTDEGLCYLRRITPYRTVTNQIEGVVITFVDITPQVMADVELNRVAALLKESEIAIIRSRPDGRISGWNRGAERMYGYTEAEALTMNTMDLVPDRLRRKAKTLFAQVLGGEQIEAVETQRVGKIGRLVNVALTATPEKDARGQVSGIVATESNIQDRLHLKQQLLNMNQDLKQRISIQQAEAADKAMQLKQREQQLSAIVSTNPNGIITVDPLGLIISFNRAAERMFGYESNEVIGQDGAMLFGAPSANGRSAWPQELATAAVEAVRKEVQGRRRDGTVFPMELSVSQVDHLDMYVLVARDVSMRRSLEREVIDVSSQEQERIGHEIHDGLGQRLTALTMLGSSLQKKLADLKDGEKAQFRELMKQLREAAAEAHRLSRGLAPVPIDPAGLKLALKSLAERVSASSGIACRLKAGRTAALSDQIQALQLYRIAQEAVNNAVKHGRPRNITIELALRNAVTTLSVIDDGAGFDNGAAAAEGLGMHIMRYRANIMGAQLEIQSKKGKGTTVRCTLQPEPAAKRRR